MNCSRCDGLFVTEYIVDPREGPLSGFHGRRCLNCGAIDDDVIRTNRRVVLSITMHRHPQQQAVRRTPGGSTFIRFSQTRFS